MYGDWAPTSELRVLGRTITLGPLKIPQIKITSPSTRLFGLSFPTISITSSSKKLFGLTFPTIWIEARELKWPASGLPIAIYGFLCDYGRSYVRPLVGLLVSAGAGALPFWFSFGWPSKFWQALGFSLASTFGVLGFRKDFVKPEVTEHLIGILKVFAAIQTVTGTVLLFLFGLAIRNRFRMK
jgi:hypothetical protein